MAVQTLTAFDPKQFFNLNSVSDAGVQRLDTKVGGIGVSNDLSGLLTVTTAEGDTITLAADLESDFRAVNYKSSYQSDGTTVDVNAKYAEYQLKQEFGVTVEGDLNEHELKDLAKLFRKVANVLKKCFCGQDEEALLKTAKLAERLGNLSSLSSLDLTVDVERSVTVFAAQLAAEVVGESGGQSALPPAGGSPGTATSPTSQMVTTGEAPATTTVIPQSSTGTTAPTPPRTIGPMTDSPSEARLTLTAQQIQQPATLVQQILDALKETRVASRKIRKYLPDFLERLREDLREEVRSRREHKEEDHRYLQDQVPAQTKGSDMVFVYRSMSQTSISLSIHG